MAADLLVNLEYRLERMLKFSKTSIQYIRDQWGVPEPYNMGVFIFLSLLSIIISQKILSKFFSRGKSLNNYKFNSPDFAEVGVLVNSLKKLHEEVTEIKKALASGDTMQKGETKASDYSNEFKLL